MKPLNLKETGCNPISSNCVIWQGPDIPCMSLCKGDTVSDVTYKLATELCTIMDILKVNAYDLSCFNLTSCKPADFQELIQFLITRICNLEDCTGCAPGCGTPTPTPTPTPDGCPDCEVNIAECFYFTNGLGDQITSLQLKDYVIAIGNKICSLVQTVNLNSTTINNQGGRITNLEIQVTNLENNPPVQFANMNVSCILPNVPGGYPLDVIVSQLEQQFCELREATGDPTTIYLDILKQCVGLNGLTQLAGTGTMESLPGWTSNVTNLADSLGNLWLTICDMRAAILNLQAAQPSICNSVILNLTANITTGNLVLFLTGVIPPALAQCTGSTPVVITDSYGGTATLTVNINSVINQPSGYVISLPGTINPASNVTVAIPYCLVDSVSGSNCSGYLQYIINNTITCPILSSPSNLTGTELNYSFTTLNGNYTYTVELYDDAGVVFIASQTQSATSISVINGLFTGLTPCTSYKMRLTIIPTGCGLCVPTICTFISASTAITAGCIAVSAVSSSLEYVPES
jgi:hypothetical protein